MINYYLSCLVDYALEKKLIAECDEVYIINQLVDLFGLDGYKPVPVENRPEIHEILKGVCDYACETGLISEDTVTRRDLFDTRVMGILTPRPYDVIWEFDRKYEVSPRVATDWFYDFCCDVNYIRKERIAKDKKWITNTEYGALDITVNLSKPEKDPKDIAAAAADFGKSKYPACLLCVENEGFAGNMRHPARQNLRLIPLELAGEKWMMQYSPYSYYPEHCIVISAEHKPMTIDNGVFERMFDFTERFPHYFVGSNADLPIVGGSILSHEHFQGGHYTFPMDRAESEYDFTVPRYSGVTCSVLKWPMSVIRLRSSDRSRITALACRILEKWREYCDPDDNIYAQDENGLHNTITPIAHLDHNMYRLDLVLRNNQISPERPMGIHHPRPEYHHIKKENIGLIEVMGLAVLPARLEKEMARLKSLILSGGDLRGDALTVSHAEWAEEILRRVSVDEGNIDSVIRREIGYVFKNVLADCSVFSDMDSFKRFIDFVSAPKSK
ncbi:MAG: UDP-glucose--hexose-1-phosphate uridylyltransferase [Clostridia bacterium]|nr:UDP-glucose--hexose-1-phosphate uridylyltransferase [Clostridia bacterium]